MPSFVHTGDLHLGKSFSRLGGLGREIRKAQRETLKRIVETVRETRSDFLVVAGDLFDANTVSARLVDDTLKCLSSIAPVPVYILPGTHDVLDSSSVYRTILDSTNLPSNVTVIPEEPTEFRPVPDVGVFAVANTAKRGGNHPLKELLPLALKSEAKYKVAVVHASVNAPGLLVEKHSPDEPLIDLDEIASSPFHYVAMGHWHKRGDWSRGNTTAIYCGPPETLGFEDVPSPGSVTLVSLGDNVVTEEKVVGTYRWLRLSLDVSLVPDTDAIVKRVGQEADRHTILRLELRGKLPHSNTAVRLGDFDLDELKEEIEPKFFFVEIDDSQLGFDEPAPGEFPPNSVGQVFREIMTEKIEKARDASEKALLEEALRRGVVYLTGKAGIRS